MIGKLFLIPTPIGNSEDITLRSISTLKDVDLIVCEELKEARRLLSKFNIQKELISLNEHNEKEVAPEILRHLKNGKIIGLISDCGSPLFSDPGHYLTNLCIVENIQIIPLPGANSLIPAITSSGLEIEKFYYYGWLSQKKDIRIQELLRLKKINEVLIILDTPYRLAVLLSDIKKIFSEKQQVVLAFDLTMKSEKIFRGSVGKILDEVLLEKLKGEFVLLIDNRK
ncbi:MAG: 16S rRNA (cytidine(1402)-2'-O)-methyltransferase [Ignavibacteriales bacterium]|nr:16S rRNA (cytidine(1402)-2'-O)-methyltransferase [Ignavibacteriales bacterium]